MHLRVGEVFQWIAQLAMMNQSNDVFTFDNGVTVSMKGLPPAPVAWLYNSLDVVCIPFQCTAWRSYFNFPQGSWLSENYRIPGITHHIPQLLSFADFRQRDIAARSVEESWLTWDSVYRYAFQTSSTTLGRLTTPTAFAVLCMLVLALRQIKALLLPRFVAVGRKAALQSHGEEWIKSNQIRLVKFGEYVFRLMYHSLIACYGMWYFHDKLWWKAGQTISVFQGYPLHEIEPGMTWYYLLQSAYNMDAFLSLMQMSIACKVQWIRRSQLSASSTRGRISDSLWQMPISITWSPNVRGDFQEMFIHHIATNVLVVGSSALHFTRIGSMVFLVHDVSDVPVDLSKLANFLKWKWVTVICFVTMALTWAYARLYILPMTIYRAMITHSHYVLEQGMTPVLSYVCYRHLFYFFLGLLIALHAAWFSMFMKMLHTLIFKNECHDYTEHKQGEAPHGSTAKGKKD